MRNSPQHNRRPLLGALIAISLLAAAGEANAATFNCVQFVQRSSAVNLHGDAWQWWEHANGEYGRGSAPAPGAVMVFSKTKILPHGHVAVVHSVHDSRTILINHANWSPFNGHRGQVEQAVKVIDVSKNNDWSQVRVWYHPTGDIGQTVYSIKGFVYPKPIHHHAR